MRNKLRGSRDAGRRREEGNKMSGPLAGVRVVDLTSVVFGPLATQILGDLGADVIKIEGPEGDTTRYTGPARSPDMAALFMGLNRNKRSVVLDLKQQAAKEALWKLVDGADVFIHSMRPDKIAALGFSPENVLARNPRIVFGGGEFRGSMSDLEQKAKAGHKSRQGGRHEQEGQGPGPDGDGSGSGSSDASDSAECTAAVSALNALIPSGT